VEVGLATFSALPGGFDGDQPLVDALEAAGARVTWAPWDDRGIEWQAFDRVIIRSTWDYSRRRDEFVEWAQRVGAPLRNAPAIVEWNSDKRYLAELAAAGLPVVPTTYVGPGDEPPELTGSVVVKPAISAGARDSGHFGPTAHSAARELLGRLTAAGRTAMVQPFQESVETAGEAALVYFGGELSHTLRKGAVLAADQEAPQREGLPGLTAAERMFDPELVRAAPAAGDVLALGAAVIDFLRGRFGHAPLYARVDAVRDASDAPVLMEIELIEPNFYFELAPGAARTLANVAVSPVG
jgi:glutathione synthase/RimK-type ligase-like ATP-grasp enzyme